MQTQSVRYSPSVKSSLILLQLFAMSCGDLESQNQQFDDTSIQETEQKVSGDDVKTQEQELLVAKITYKIEKNNWHHINFLKKAGYRYTIWIQPTVGDTDLFGHYSGIPSTTYYQYKSVNGSTKPDALPFFAATQTGQYFVGVYAYSVSTVKDPTNGKYYATGTLYVLESPLVTTPAELYKKLKWPFASYTTLTDDASAVYKFGEFGATWGNPVYGLFFTGYVSPKFAELNLALS